MYSPRSTSLYKNNFWVLLRIHPISSAKLGTLSMAEGIGSHQFVSSFHTCITSKPMSHFLRKSILFGSCYVSTLPYIFPHRWISSSSNQQSFTVSYLVESLGLSPRIALSVSKHVSFKTAERPDRVINLFKNYGFTQTQISKLVRGVPVLLALDAEKIILPKLEFFKAKGILGPEMAKNLSVRPSVLLRSLNYRILPSYEFFRSFFQSDDKVIVAVKHFPDILTHDVEKYAAPNIDILRGHGVPDNKIAKLILNWPMSFLVSPDSFRKIVEKVDNMGFETSKISYVIALCVFQTVNESKWQSKVDAYKKWGWSEEDVLHAFCKSPWCMMLSEDKLMAGMDFFINQMDLKPCLIAKHPILLSWSLKKRIIPRFSVFQVLLSKGLVKKDISLVYLLNISNKIFLQKFVTPYNVEAPELLNLYKEKLNLPNGLPLVDKV